MRKLLSVFFSVALALAMLPATAFAVPEAGAVETPTLNENGNIAEGTIDDDTAWGTCAWEISADGTLSVHQGTGVDTVEREPGSVWNKTPWRANVDDVKRVVFENVTAPEIMDEIFANMHNLEFVDLSGINTSGTTSMYGMFMECSSLTSINFKGFDTSNVTGMGNMFGYCSSLASVDVTSFDTSKVTAMSGMFNGCSSLAVLDLSNFNTSMVSSEDLGDEGVLYLMCGCSSLEKIVFGENVTCIAVEEGCSEFTEYWQLQSTGEYLSPAYITANRLGIADTYVKPATLPLDQGDTVSCYPSDGAAYPYGQASWVYDGKERKPSYGVSAYGKELSEGVDFEVQYPEDMTNAGKKDITITGKGRYTGAIQAEAFVECAPFGKVTLSSTQFEYDGTEKKPDITVVSSFDPNLVLQEGVDYVVSWQTYMYPGGLTSVGTKGVIIGGMGNYTDAGAGYYTFKVVESPEHAPKILDGEGSSWNPESNTSVTFRSNAPLSEFIRVELDGKFVDRANYDLKEGSTIVELKQSFLETLPKGEHKLGIVSYSGTAVANFVVAQEQTAPDTPGTTDPAPDTPKPDKPGTVDPKPDKPGTTDPKPDGTDKPGVTDPEPVATQVMFRLYNPNSGEHFYTASSVERDHLVSVGWNDEGEAWTAPVTSATPVYRLYSGTDHHYTTSVVERDHLISVGWSDEGIGWYSDDAQGIGLHRLFNPNVDPSAERNNSGSHHYTTSEVERDDLVSRGWRYEDLGWYGVK